MHIFSVQFSPLSTAPATPPFLSGVSSYELQEISFPVSCYNRLSYPHPSHQENSSLHGFNHHRSARPGSGNPAKSTEEPHAGKGALSPVLLLHQAKPATEKIPKWPVYPNGKDARGTRIRRRIHRPTHFFPPHFPSTQTKVTSVSHKARQT